MYLISNFTGGELSPRLNGRSDIAKYRSGCRQIENFVVLPHGGARKRSGTKFLIEQASSSEAVRLHEFQYNTEQSYCLLFGPSYVWFFKDQGIITQAANTITGITAANPGVVTTSGAHGYSNGDKVYISGVAGMTEVNNRWFTIAGVTATTFEIVDTSAYAAYDSAGSAAEIVELATTYTESQLDDLDFAQIHDTLYIVHPDHPLRKLTRSSDTSWTLSTPTIDTGPFRTINGDRDHKLTPSDFNLATITGITQANPGVVTCSGGHSFVNGETVTISGVGGMTALNGNSYAVANATATTFELSGTDTSAMSAYTSGGQAVLDPTAYGTYNTGVTFTLTSTDAVFDADMVGGYFRLWEEGAESGATAPPFGDRNISVAVGDVYTYQGHVYGVGAISAAHSWLDYNRVPDHTSGTMRVHDASARYFDSDYLHSGYCVVKITAYTSSTVVTAEVVRYQMPDAVVTSGTSFWEEGAWSNHRGWPAAIAFHEQRLFLAGTVSDPGVIWGSVAGAYENFEDGADDNDALLYRVVTGQADIIRWLRSGRALMAGTTSGEFILAASNQNEALTPTNTKVMPQTSWGTSNADVVKVGNIVIYPQRNGEPTNNAKKIREYSYEFAADAFKSVDLTVFSEHITGDGVTELVYAREPDSIIYALRSDGVQIGLTYEQHQEVVAWHRHVLGGTGARIKSMAVIPGADGDDIYLSVERTINSGTVRYMEVLTQAFGDTAAKADAFFVDGGLTYSGSSTSTITGLWHLRGETVQVLNGGDREDKTVSATGSITLDNASDGANVHIGLGYVAKLETQELDQPSERGSAQGREKRIAKVWIRLLNSMLGKAGPDAANLEPLLYITGNETDMDSSPELFSGIAEIDFAGVWDQENRVYIEHDAPFPFHITGLLGQINVS
jgi:hypothetical protein